MKTILLIFFNIFFITLISCSQENKNAAQINIASEYDEWMNEMSGVYEGNIDVSFADGSCTTFGRICIDLLNDNPSVSIDGVLIPDFKLTKNNIKNNTWYIYSLIDINYDENSNSCIARFADEYGMNDGEDFNYIWHKTGDAEMAKTEIEKLKSDNKIFSQYWEKFIIAFMNNNFKEITSNVSFPIVDSCTKEVINNEFELENKLRNVLSWQTTEDMEKNSDQLRIVDHYAKIFGGKYYFQRNSSIFWDIIDGEVKLMNFHCGFG
ncbi:MAG: hypothetical protein JSS91_07990 [Bacteroidetes bacterium]|nr:hypothetical protein [Bacteroidota bacterium]